MMDSANGPDVRKVALIGNNPPRLCGIATFTRDVRNGLLDAFPDLTIDVYAMNDRSAHHVYPDEVVCSIDQDDLSSYARAAHRINASGADVVCVQHEYGIFGGAAGAHLLKLLDRVTAPVVVTLHTVLEQPTPEQRAVMEALARRASTLIVMAEKGRRILQDVHGIAEDRIAVVPHGAPDRAMGDGEAMKRRFRCDGRKVLLTFGLLSPNKGIETMIRAMPTIAARHPDALYVVLGATHPHLVAHEGEAYRERLMALADELGVSRHVRFIDGFVEQPRLLDFIAAADVYVTPYLNEQQITSGTLSYAVALGKPVVSTPYWHAAELLAGGVGMLVPFGDSSAFAARIIELLDRPETLDEMSRRAWSVGRSMTWPAIARAYVAIFEEAVRSQPARLFPGVERNTDPVPPRLGAVERLSDGVGIIQHSIFSVPDRTHGYCVDDNCRALMLMHRIDGPDSVRADELAAIYAAFVQHAWNGQRGRFRNFMAFDRAWLEEEGSEDSFGRTLWSLGDTAARARSHELRRWASHLFDQVAPHVRSLGSPRTWAFAMIAADAMLEAHPGHELAVALLRDLGARLHARLAEARLPGWEWFEAVLAYDNARLPEALLRAGRRLDDPVMRAEGLATLAWLDAQQSNDDGQFRAIGTDSFGREYMPPLPFDQQPVEAWASIDAARIAHEITGELRWEEMARKAYAWYLGANDVGLPLGSVIDGGCFDGLMSDRVNLNQGAESVLAFQFACCAMREMAEKAEAEGSGTKAGIVAS
ncbi:glycosyltransferase family 4 protein [Sphingomonas oryzagri]|uniref:Glycosyltransferase family 4 protein n=1 Tax=Sphingomonas oryzagri TaxID=3042314 RepID=A0ABT6MYA4_9SPHN|nr:glycosyltransferase family 4 protein [Sphingomonas oryzagri]MDH7638040.1 glycosyltransferase family 4 protein [Sphingomonas oryzagri]